MKIFLDTADINAIKKWAPTGLIDGITTNPTHLARAGGNPKERVLELCSLLPDGDISVEVVDLDAQRMYQQAKIIAALAKNITVKIPCHPDYYEVIKQLTLEKVPLNITLVFTLLQGLMMAKLGVKYISPFVGRLDDIDVEGLTVLHEMKQMMTQYNFKTQILAASLRHVRHFHHAVMAGVDVATVPVDLFEKALHHPLTDRGIAQFDADWGKLGIKQFP